MFVLGDDLRLFEEGMNLQLRIVGDSAHSAYRKHPYAALMALWSRAFMALEDGGLLVTRGAYATCTVVVRAACEYIAAQQQLSATEMEQFLDWLARHLRPDEERKAFELGMGRYFAGETLASDTPLRGVYRAASELGRPNFGATLLAAGPESSHQRLALTFADRTFHLGWAELTLGWLLALCERQLAVAVHAGDMFAVGDETHGRYTAFAGKVAQALARRDRCSVEEIEVENLKRYLVHNFRRQPSGAPKRILL
jgi:hypothetical protein